MKTPHAPQAQTDGFPPLLTPERAQCALERVAAIRERIRRRDGDVQLSQLPDPGGELVKARATAAPPGA